MKTRIEEWTCDCTAEQESLGFDGIPFYLESRGLKPTYIRPNFKTRFTFRFENWKSVFKTFQYSFDAIGITSNIDWRDTIAKSPIGLIKFQDIMKYLPKGAPAKVLCRERSYWK